jgi:hypothetical protein
MTLSEGGLDRHQLDEERNEFPTPDAGTVDSVAPGEIRIGQPEEISFFAALPVAVDLIPVARRT